MKKNLILFSILLVVMISPSFADDGPNLEFSMTHQFIDYTLKVTNNDLTDLNGATFKIYILGSIYQVTFPPVTGPSNESPYDSAKRKTYQVFQTISKDNISIGSAQSLDIPLGKIDLKSTGPEQTVAAGTKGPAPVYEGFVVQVSILNHVILTKASSSNIHFMVAYNAASQSSDGNADPNSTMAAPGN